MTKVKEIMLTEVVTAPEDTSIVNAAKLMKKFDVGSVVVVRDKEGVGICTGGDVLYKAIAMSKDLKKTTLAEVMSAPLITINPDADIQLAAERMTEEHVKKLIVIENGTLIGIITARELLEHSPEFMNIYVGLEGENEKPPLGS